MKIPMPVVFALGTALCWGLYGPVLGQARSPERLYTPFKPYVGVGAAYFVWALVGGLLVMRFNGDNFVLTGAQSRAAVWGFAAGTLGAWGALTLTAAMFSGGTAMPHVVMPIVFGGAVTVTAITTIVQSHGTARVSPWLWVGILGMIVCVVLIASNTPHAVPHAAEPAGAAPTSEGGGTQE